MNPRVLNLERNDIGDVGMHALARHLRDDARLETLQLRGCHLPRSTTRAMSEFGLAFEANVGLVTLDLRGARTPAQLARGLRRTVEKRPTVAPSPRSGRRSYYASIGTACAATRTLLMWSSASRGGDGSS